MLAAVEEQPPEQQQAWAWARFGLPQTARGELVTKRKKSPSALHGGGERGGVARVVGKREETGGGLEP